jgi:hypothetical protein
MLINPRGHLFFRLWLFLFDLPTGEFVSNKIKVTTFFILFVFMVVWAFRGFTICAQGHANTSLVSKRMVENFILRVCELTSAAKTARTYLNVRLRGSVDP